MDGEFDPCPSRESQFKAPKEITAYAMYISDVCALTQKSFKSTQSNPGVDNFWRYTVSMTNQYKAEASALKATLRNTTAGFVTRDADNVYIVAALKAEGTNMSDIAKNMLFYLRSHYTSCTNRQIRSAISRYDSEHFKKYNTFPGEHSRQLQDQQQHPIDYRGENLMPSGYEDHMSGEASDFDWHTTDADDHHEDQLDIDLFERLLNDHY